MTKLQQACHSTLNALRAVDKGYRNSAISALSPMMLAVERGDITTEEYEAFVGESYADTLNRKFTYQLMDARDAAESSNEKGVISAEEMAALMARLDAAGCPPRGDMSTLAERVTMPPDEDPGEGE